MTDLTKKEAITCAVFALSFYACWQAGTNTDMGANLWFLVATTGVLGMTYSLRQIYGWIVDGIKWPFVSRKRYENEAYRREVTEYVCDLWLQEARKFRDELSGQKRQKDKRFVSREQFEAMQENAKYFSQRTEELKAELAKYKRPRNEKGQFVRREG